VAVTHDELMIYRLINCNWSTSELFVCRDGVLKRESNFASHRLSSWKDEVRRAEEAEAVSMNLQTNHCSVNAFNSEKVSPMADVTNKEVAASVSSIPPWLRRAPARRGKEKKTAAHDVITEQENIPANLLGVCSFPDAKLSDSAMPGGSDVADRKSTQDRNAQLVPPEVIVNMASSTPIEDVLPASWEDLEDCSDDLGLVAVQAFESQDVQRETCMVISEITLNSNQKKLRLESSSCDQTYTTDGHVHPKQCDGKHSRFRKDLVNLNKAVTKWIRQEQAGLTSRKEIVEKIKESSVARQLRTLHGEDFDPDRFVQEAINRSLRIETERRS